MHSEIKEIDVNKILKIEFISPELIENFPEFPEILSKDISCSRIMINILDPSFIIKNDLKYSYKKTYFRSYATDDK